MATGTRNKRTTQQEMKAKLSGRLNEQARHLASLVTHVDSIADAKQRAGEDIEELKDLGLTMTEIEEATGISVYQLRTFVREARQKNPGEEDGTDARETTSGEKSSVGDVQNEEKSSSELRDGSLQVSADASIESELARS